MARRRFNRSKSSPDRGWFVGFNNITLVKPSGVQPVTVGPLFDFADIDVDALVGRIEQDKSDWFIKRVIFEAYAAVSFENTEPTDVARVWQLGLGTMSNANADEMTDDPGYVVSSEVYNRWARLFRTWTRPVYAGGLIPYTAEYAVAVPGSSGGNPDAYGTTAPFWGPSMIEADFEVSNAGLRGDQTLLWAVSLSEGPASFDWDIGDTLYLTLNWRVLLQKRR